MGEEANRELSCEEINQLMIESTIPVDELPAPRLELRWRRESDGVEAYCDYNIVFPLHKYDIRKDGYEADGPVLRFRLSWTRTTQKKLEYGGIIETPYRDGTHILWDAKALGLPAFVVLHDKAQKLFRQRQKPLEAAPTVEEEEDVSLVDSDWAPRIWRSRLHQAKRVLVTLQSDFQEEAKRHGDGTLFSTYLLSSAEEVGDLLKHLDRQDHPHPFGHWLVVGWDGFLSNTKTVCEECGLEVSEDLTQACEHIIKETDRKLLEKE